MTDIVLQTGSGATDVVHKAQSRLIAEIMQDSATAILGCPVKADYVPILDTKFSVFTSARRHRSNRQEVRALKPCVTPAGEVYFEPGPVTSLSAKYRGEAYKASDVLAHRGTALTAHKDGVLKSRPVGNMIVVFHGKVSHQGQVSDDPVFAVHESQADKVRLGDGEIKLLTKPATYGEFVVNSKIMVVKEAVSLRVVERGHKGMPLKAVEAFSANNMWTWPPETIAAAMAQMTDVIAAAKAIPVSDKRSPWIVAKMTKNMFESLVPLDKPVADLTHSDAAAGCEDQDQHAARAEAIMEATKVVGDAYLVPFEFVPSEMVLAVQLMWDLSHMQDRWFGDNAVMMSVQPYPDPQNSVLDYDGISFDLPPKEIPRTPSKVMIPNWLFS